MDFEGPGPGIRARAQTVSGITNLTQQLFWAMVRLHWNVRAAVLQDGSACARTTPMLSSLAHRILPCAGLYIAQVSIFEGGRQVPSSKTARSRKYSNLERAPTLGLNQISR